MVFQKKFPNLKCFLLPLKRFGTNSRTLSKRPATSTVLLFLICVTRNGIGMRHDFNCLDSMAELMRQALDSLSDHVNENINREKRWQTKNTLTA